MVRSWTQHLFVLAAIAVSPLQAPPQQTFRIVPLRPIPVLRKEALTARPPRERGDFVRSDLVDLAKLDPRIKFDIRYATADNFLGTPVYSSSRALLQRPAAEALVRVLSDLATHGLGLVVFDAYRPWYVTKVFWDATPADKHQFVANPDNGSRHNRGCAIDLTLYDLATGSQLPMTSEYDEMSSRAYSAYDGGTPEERANRQLLRQAMEAQGFTSIESEWWHFDFAGWQHYAIQNAPVETFR